MHSSAKPLWWTFSPKQTPFVHISHYLLAEGLILLPLKSFNRLADELGDPDDRNVSMINMTSRSGSTLLLQIMDNVPGCRTQSEPFPSIHAHGMHIRKEISRAQYLRLIRSCIRLQCKKEHSRNDTHLVIKSNCLAAAIFPVIRNMFPKFTFIYNTRHFKPSLKSLMKMTNSLPQFSPWKKFVCGHLPFPHDQVLWWDRYEDWVQRKCLESTTEEDFAFLLGAHMKEFLETKRIYALSIVYEELMADPKACITNLFKVLSVSKQHLPAALDALNHDSQKGVFGARGTEQILIDPETWRKCDLLFKEFELPISSTMTVEEFQNVFRM